MEALLQDLRLALRQLVKNPAFTTVAVLTLALGIGANTAIFSAVHAVLLRPLPFPESDRLAEVVSTGMGGQARFGVSYPDLLDLRRSTRDYSGVAAYTTQLYNLSGAGDPREVAAALVTADLFGVLGVGPQIGRTFTAAEERDPVAILSYGLWAASYGRDPAIVGKGISLDGRSYTVVGVMPPDFRFPDENIQLWTPIGGVLAEEPQAMTMRGFHTFNAIARLAPGISLVDARRDLDVLAKQIAAAEGSDSSERQIVVQGGAGGGGGGGPRPGGFRAGGGSPLENGFSISSLRDAAIGDVSSRLFILLGAVGLVLLIACANAANLLLARAASRRREMAIRRALGAGRGRLVRQLLVESVLLALTAAALGLVFATWGLQALLALWPGVLPRAYEIGLDGVVLAFTIGLAVVTGIAFGLVPALRASAPGLEEALREDSAATTGGRRRRLQGGLIVAEVALALVLLVGAGLLVRSFIALNRVNPGFDTRDVLAARIRLTPARYPSGAQQQEFFRTVLASLAVRPGVVDPSLSIILPLSGSARVIAFDPRDIRPDFPDPVMVARLSAVSADYFAALRIPIREGRAFTPEDRRGAPSVAIVNRRFARTLWPDQSPVGRSFPVGMGPVGPPVTVTVVGVIDDIRTDALDQTESPAELYLPALQEATAPQMWVVVRSRDGSPLKLTGAIRDAVRLADPEQPIADIVSLGQLISRQTAGRRFNTTLLGVFALLAVGLALVGIYGVTGYAVAQRHRELGIRMALGARPADVVRLLLAESLVRVAIGVGLGLAIAFVASKALTKMLFGVTASDATTFLGTALLLAAVALLATWLPARRATRVDPMVSLRTE